MILEGKRALVTGGSVRIGRAITEALQTVGAQVIIQYRMSTAAAQKLSPFTIQADLESALDFSELIERAGPLDILINNAALFTRDRLSESSPEKVRREFSVNLFAPIELTRRFAAQAAEGAVINLLDRRIRANDPACLSYSISKKGLEELTKISALELAPNIRVNAVAPGAVLPPPGKNTEEFREQAGQIPLGQLPTLEGITQAVLFLLRNECCTGQVIYVDGGQHLLGNGV